jgi:hypothetical protein
MATPIHCFDVSANGQNIFLGLEGGKLTSKTRSKKSIEADTGD